MRLADIVAQFETPLIERYGARLLPSARRALAAIKHCRHPDAPQLLAACATCPATATIAHACGHRACPRCQHHDTEQWLARQRQRLLPVDYFLVTFTLPAELRPIAWDHQRTVYDAMMQCAWRCLDQFAHNDRTLAAQIGAVAVLHTHSRRLDYHPHVHLVVPAGGIDHSRQLWRRKDRYLFNQRNLATVYRAKLLHALENADLHLPDSRAPRWVVDCRNVGRGDAALTYLARYLYRGVISEHHIVACRDRSVTFRYTDSKTNATRLRTLPGEDFLWLILKHVLPRRFRRVREYGLLHHKCRSLLRRVQCLLRVKLEPYQARQRPPMLCPRCRSPMRILGTQLSYERMRIARATSTLSRSSAM